MRSSISLGLSFTVLLACAGACKAPTPPSSPPVATTTAAAEPTPGAPPAPAAAIGAPRASRCRLTVSDTEGCQANQVEELVAPVRPQIEHCRGSKGGKLEVSVKRLPGGKLAFEPKPGTSLDPMERKCVLDALNSLNQTESSTAWTGGAAIPPSGFTSLITIEW